MPKPPPPHTPSAAPSIGGSGDPSLQAPAADPFPNMVPPGQQAPMEVPPLPDAAPPESPETQGEELSPEEQVMFSTLLTCGRRTKTLTVFDHTVVVQTLCCDDDLRIGMYVKDYQGSAGEARAYQVGVVAAGIRSIDSQAFVSSNIFQDANSDALFDERFKKVSKMYPTVVTQIYRAIMDAEKEFIELSIRLGKLQG